MAYPPKKIVVLEDDDIWASDIAAALRSEFGDSLVVEDISRELEFIDRFPDFRDSPPDLFILDVRVIWCRLTPDLRLPDKEHSDRATAGIRCLKMVRELSPPVPAILWSLLEEGSVQIKAVLNGVQTFDYAAKEDGIPAILKQIPRLLRR